MDVSCGISRSETGVLQERLVVGVPKSWIAWYQGVQVELLYALQDLQISIFMMRDGAQTHILAEVNTGDC